MIKYFLLVGIIASLCGCASYVDMPDITLQTIVLPTPLPLPTVAAIVPIATPMVQPPGCHDARDERVSFVPGTYSATVANSGDWCYIFWAAAGQQMTVYAGMTSGKAARIEFMIPGVKAVDLTRIDNGIFTASLPADADYALLVDTIDGTESHQITIEIR